MSQSGNHVGDYMSRAMDMSALADKAPTAEIKSAYRDLAANWVRLALQATRRQRARTAILAKVRTR